MSEIVDGLNRLAYQFKGSPNIAATFGAALAQFEELRIVDADLKLLRYLDSSVGAQLDGVGEIIGLERPTKPIDDLGLFGFEFDTTAKGFGDISDSDLGGNFWDGSPADEALIGDDLYRLLIRAKIIKNQTAMTVDDTTRLISFMFGGVPVRYFSVTNLTARYDIGKILDQFDLSLLEDLPLLIGIGDVTYHAVYDAENSFGFDSDPNALGFGDINDTDTGGIFAKIIT